jgi:hypothetical protein
MEMLLPYKLWATLAIMGCALGAVTTFSIRAGPSSSEAIIAIRVAHQELYWATIAFRDPALHEAASHLTMAWSTLGERQYEQSVFAASKSIQRVRDIKGQVLSLYSRRGDGMKLDTSNWRDS